MPTTDGRMTPEEAAHAQRWMADRWKERACPVCGSANMGLESYIVRTDVLMPLPTMVGPQFAFLAMTCASCAYTALFNAALILPTFKPAELSQAESQEVKRG